MHRDVRPPADPNARTHAPTWILPKRTRAPYRAISRHVISRKSHRYCKDVANVFDGFIVITSLIELFMAPPEFVTGVYVKSGGVKALRVCRLFRLFKLAKKWDAMHELMEKTISTMFQITDVLFLLLLFMYAPIPTTRTQHVIFTRTHPPAHTPTPTPHQVHLLVTWHAVVRPEAQVR